MPFAAEQCRAEQNDVSGLSVRKNSAAAPVSIRILKAAGQHYTNSSAKAVGHLSVKATADIETFQFIHCAVVISAKNRQTETALRRRALLTS